MGLFRDDTVYEERDEIQRNKTNEANTIVLEWIKRQYEERWDDEIRSGKRDDSKLKYLEENYQFVEKLLDVQKLLQSSRVKYTQKFGEWEVYIKGELQEINYEKEHKKNKEDIETMIWSIKKQEKTLKEHGIDFPECPKRGEDHSRMASRVKLSGLGIKDGESDSSWLRRLEKHDLSLLELTHKIEEDKTINELKRKEQAINAWKMIDQRYQREIIIAVYRELYPSGYSKVEIDYGITEDDDIEEIMEKIESGLEGGEYKYSEALKKIEAQSYKNNLNLWEKINGIK